MSVLLIKWNLFKSNNLEILIKQKFVGISKWKKFLEQVSNFDSFVSH